VTRLSVRLRLTLAATAAMALVIAALGMLAYRHLQADLDTGIGQDLESRSADLVALVQASGGRPHLAGGRLDDLGDQAAEVLAPNGSVLAASAPLKRSLLTADQFRRAQRHRLTVVLHVPGMDERLRLRAFPLGSDVGVVGAGLGDRDDALASLRRILLLVGPLALLAIAAGTYAVAAFALRPVEAMRRRADEITPDHRGERLPVPASGDEIARLGVTLNRMIGRLEDGLERERRFVADASHDLRSPLARLKAELELALDRPHSNEELVAALGSAAEEADRLAALTERLLAMARIEDGPPPAADLAVAPLLEAVAQRYPVPVATTCEPGDAVVRANRLQLEQALANLVDNAFEHGSGRVALTAACGDGVVRFAVADEGEGFPAAFLPHAFERLRRADDARTGGGAGLGLAIVAAVAEAHGGTAYVRNTAHGPEVGFRVPVVSRTAGASRR
jgi:signal transduction histidine kinase